MSPMHRVPHVSRWSRSAEGSQRRVDAGLREVLAGERPPDVVAAALARHAAGDGAELEAELAAPSGWSARSWVLAAVVLLGLCAVFGVAWANRDDGAEAPAGQEPAPRLPQIVASSAIAELPVELRAIEAHGLDDAGLRALLARCPQLEHVRLVAKTFGALQLRSEVILARGGRQSITDASLPALAALPNLRRLELLGTLGVRGSGLRELVAAPRLTALWLGCIDLDAGSLAALPRVPALRELGLDFNLGLDAADFAAIGDCPGLRTLSLRQIGGVQPEWFEPLGRLRGLEELDLARIGPVRPIREFAVEQAFPHVRQDLKDGRRVGIDMLQVWPRLRRLDVSGSDIGGDEFGRPLLRCCPQLEELVLDHGARVLDISPSHLLDHPRLRVLSLVDCPKLTPNVIDSLRHLRSLQRVAFGRAPWFELPHARRLAEWGIHAVVTDRAPEFLAEIQRLSKDIAARRDGGAHRTLHALADVQALPAEVTAVDLWKLGDSAAAALANHPQVRRVALRGGGAEPMTGPGLRAVLGLPSLRAFEVSGVSGSATEALRELGRHRELQRLALAGVVVDDALLAAVAALPELQELELHSVRGVTDAGFTALASLRGLRRLDLADLAVLSSQALASVGRLRSLHTLELRDLPGCDDRVFAAITELTDLRALAMPRSRVTAPQFASLAKLSRLTRLTLSGHPQWSGELLAHLPPSLEILELAGCPGLTSSLATATAWRERLPNLRQLDLSGNPWVTDALLAGALAAPNLEKLDVGGCRSLTPTHAAALRGAAKLSDVSAVGARIVDDADLARLREERPTLTLHTRVW